MEPEIRVAEEAVPSSSESEFYRNQCQKLSEELKAKQDEIAQLKSTLRLQQPKDQVHFEYVSPDLHTKTVAFGW